MRWRPGHLALLVFQALWLNVVLPGHTRGAITLPRTGCADCAAPPRVCCLADRLAPATKPQPTPKQRANCAICAFAARVAPPPPVGLAPVRLALRAVLPPPAPRVGASLEFRPTYYGNGPPAAFV